LPGNWNIPAELPPGLAEIEVYIHIWDKLAGKRRRRPKGLVFLALRS